MERIGKKVVIRDESSIYFDKVALIVGVFATCDAEVFLVEVGSISFAVRAEKVKENLNENI